MKKVGDIWVPDRETQMLKEIERTGGFQLDRLRQALTHVPQHATQLCALDIGAHVGTWTLELARTFHDVFAFEPCFETFECLRRNVEENYRIGRVTIFRHCVSDKAGIYHISIPDSKYDGGNTGGNFMVPTVVATSSADVATTGGVVTSVTIDQYKFPRVDFMKIDVEGMEPFVIEGAKETIRRCRPVILFEHKPKFRDRYGETRSPMEMLSLLGMRPYEQIKNDHIWGW